MSPARIVLSLLGPFLFALGLTAISLPASATPVPSAPTVDAESYILMDFNSGRELAAEVPDSRVEPASITKMMTGYVVFHSLQSGSISLDDQVTISERAWRMPGSRMFIEVDSQVSVENLLKGMIIQSGNDASVALAEHVAGSESAFVDLMNHYAGELGMDNTHYTNSTGLPHEEQYTTARDIAVLARALIAEFPEYYEWYSVKEFTYNGIDQDNRNSLLWRDESVDGIKTGHTSSAGYCLASSAKRGNTRLISVVMGSSDEQGRARASQTLLNYGFRFYETHRLYAAGEVLSSERVWGGAEDTVEVGLQDDLFVTIPRGRYSELDPVMELPERLHAPLPQGEQVGTVQVSLDGEVVVERPLHSLNGVEKGGLWTRMVDRIKLFFQ